MTEHETQKTAKASSEQTPNDLIAGGKLGSLWEHVGELRTRLVRSVAIIFGLFCVAMAFADKLINFLKVPLVASLPPGVNALHFTGPMDVFMAEMKVAGLAAVLVGSPFWLYQFWKFIEPALYPKERRSILPFVVASVLLFFAGIVFCFEIMLPTALSYFVTVGMEVGTPIITVADYISLVMLLFIGFGLVFETPVLLVLLGVLGIVDVKGLSGARRVVAVVTLIASAIITPTPDPFNMLIMAAPMYIMYEISILILKFLGRRSGTAA